MSGTMYIGRADALYVDKASPSPDGDRLTIAGTVIAADRYEYAARRQQITGLVDNPDEEIVPLQWTSDGVFDGFYRVISASFAPWGPMTSNRARYVIDLERVPGFAAPAFEVTLQSVVRTNGHSITTPAGIVAASLADASLAIGFLDLRPDLISASSFARKSSVAAVDWTVYYATAPQALTSYRFSLPAAYYYRDACLIEVEYNYGSNVYYPLTGTQIPAGKMWRISNGLVRLTCGPISSSGAFEILGTGWEYRNVGHYDSVWSRTEIGKWGGYTTGLMPATVLRNSPEQVSIAVPGSRGGEMVYSLQRFARLATCSWSSPTATQVGVGLGLAHTATGTNITGGIRATSNDVNGNRMVFGVDAAKTTNTTITGVINTTPATSGTLFIGCELDGSSATTKNTAADLVDQFIGQAVWRQRVVAR